jgi:tetratricopeptide (TPR) repeat protein
MIYANYLEKTKTTNWKSSRKLPNAAKTFSKPIRPTPTPGTFHAYALGRYSQGISIQSAGQGLGRQDQGKSRAGAMTLAPKHADAHIALGTWHAEIIDKVGSLVGGLTYGAKKEASEKHFRSALELNPDSAIARTEYADGLVMTFGRSRLKDAEKLYDEAIKCTAVDAMEYLDLAAAKAEMDED